MVKAQYFMNIMFPFSQTLKLGEIISNYIFFSMFSNKTNVHKSDFTAWTKGKGITYQNNLKNKYNKYNQCKVNNKCYRDYMTVFKESW